MNILDHPLFVTVVDQTELLYQIYGPEVFQELQAEINLRRDNSDNGTAWGPENPETGARSHPRLTELVDSVEDENLRNLLPTEVICVHGQPPSTNPTRLANVQYFMTQYKSFEMSGTQFRALHDFGSGTVITTPVEDLPPGTVIVDSSYFTNRPVQKKYFWTVPPVTDAFVWADPTANYWETPRQQTMGRTAFNLDSLLAMIEDYIRKYPQS